MFIETYNGVTKMISPVVYVIGVLIVGALGFLCGKFAERGDWSNLVDKGVLPTPGRRWRFV